MNEIFGINGTNPDVRILSVQRDASVLDGENAGRLKNGNMVRDLIGTFYNYTLTAMPNEKYPESYNVLYETITAPIESHSVSLPFGQGAIDFRAYITNTSDKLRQVKNDAKAWENLTFTAIAMEPQRYYGENWSMGTGSGNDLLTVNGVGFDAAVKSLERKGSVLDSDQAKRSASGSMNREIIGTFYNYTLELETKIYNALEYDRLYYALTAPTDSMLITVPYGAGTLSFQAYISAASDKLLFSNENINFWSELKIDFIAMAPQRR